MPFIGNQPALSYTSFAKQDFTTSATTSYTLDNPVTNENELALFINFVRQEPTTAYTASGTNLNLTSATSASDDMYCVFLGKAVQTVNPPNGSVGLSQLSATGTKDSTTFLRGDNSFSTISAGITMSDFWILNADVTISGSNVLLNTANLVQSSVTTSGFIGTGMSYSSGYFTFPSTGIYQITVVYDITTTSGQDVALKIWTTTDNSTYNQRTAAYQYCPSNQLITGVSNFIFDVTDTTTHKLGLYSYAVGGGTTTLRGNSTQAETQITFTRLGDT